MATKSRQNYVLDGRITNLEGNPVAGLTVRAFDQDPNTPDNPLGEVAVTDDLGCYAISFNEKDFKIGGMESGGPDVFICVYGEGDLLGKSPVHRNAKNKLTIDLQVNFIPLDEKNGRNVEGHIVLEHGLPANKLKLRLYSYTFGGTPVMVGETITGEDGAYKLEYKLRSPAGRLEMRAIDAIGKEVSLSKPLDHSSDKVNINLIAPATLQPLEAEYHRLKSDLIPRVGEMRNLAGVKENEKTQDLTVLNRTTGWDARLIALASTAERLVADPDLGLPSDALYGLLRAGLPSDKLLLAQIEPDVVEMALKKVRGAGIVHIDDAGIATLKKKFTSFANKTQLEMPVPGARWTYGKILESSGLPPGAQAKFAPVYLKHRGDGTQLWEEARKAGLDGEQIGRLRLQGKLAFLAGNSEAMTIRLLNKGLKDPMELAEQDFYSPAAWKAEVFEQAGVPKARWANPTVEDLKKLDVVIPTTYTDEKVEDRLDTYAEDMARKVRLSYPTQVLGRLMETDRRFKLSSGHGATVKLFKKAIAQGFRLGETPVSMFLQSHPDLGEGLGKVDLHTATEQLKTMQRVYQITPSNEAMPVLMSLGIKSAFDVTAYREEQFVSLFQAKYLDIWRKPAPTGVPELINRKATQVSSVTYNLFAIAKKLDSEPPVRAISGTTVQQSEAKSALKGALKAYPTMESLFGSMDYCECEHCRSVLSPAAYLVDLLQFVDTEPGVWGNFLAQWKEKHGGAEYQADWNKKQDGTARKDEERKPYDALIARRPDLPHIPLTCENTNIALPYIDVVNEILEYYVAKGKLAKDAARDTGDATTAELLAEPQYVIPKAYDALRAARYPLNLPFDLWLETVRKICDYCEIPLHRVLEVMRPDEDLSAPIQNPTNIGNATVTLANDAAARLTNGTTCTYHAAGTNAPSGEWKPISGIGVADSGGTGQTTITFVGTWASAPSAGDRLVSRPLDHRAAIFMEFLGLSSTEVEIFADPDPLPKWYELYGFATEADATTEATDAATDQRVDLNSAKALSRRLGVTYKEITDIVQTAFVNPELSKLSLLYKLGVSVRDAKLYKEEQPFYVANKVFYETASGKVRSELSLDEQKKYDELAEKRAGRDVTGWNVLHEVDAFEQRLRVLAKELYESLDNAELLGKIEEFRSEIEKMPFDKVLVLADSDAGCNFDQTTLQYADSTKADSIVFLRINLFVRLWRKLGWSIDETDRALTTFVPKSVSFDGTAGKLAKQPLKTTLIYLAHIKELDERLNLGKQSRLKLVTLWSNIATTGKKPLYAQLFLNRSVLKSSPVFNHPLGQYLTDPTVKLKDHMLALQGALGLTAEEIGRILSDVGKSLHSVELSLGNVSLLYRYAILAKALKLPVRELIALKQLCGLDPFKPLHTESLETLDQDYPFCQTLEFVKVAEEVKDSGLKIEDLEFLLQHRFDETGKYRPNRDAALALLKLLAEGVRGIRVEHTLPDDPDALKEEVLRQKLGLALPPDVVERLLGMMNTTAEFTATVNGVEKVNELTKLVEEARKLADAGDTEADRIREVRYTEVPHKEQKLTVRGVVLDPASLIAKLKANLSAGQSEAFEKLLNELKKLAREFFENQLKRQPLRLAGEAGFLDDEDFNNLFATLKPLKKIDATDSPAEVEFKQKENREIEEKNQKELQKRRHRIGEAFLPFLQERLIGQFIVDMMTVHTGADPVLVESLVGDNRLLAAPKALLDIFAATATRGLYATFWPSADASGQPKLVLLSDADTSIKNSEGKPLRPAGADSARLDGYLEVPITGAYRFYVELDKQNAEAELRFPHRPEPVLVKGMAGPQGATLGDRPDEYVELKAGVLYRLSLELKHLNGGDARLLVQGESLPKGPLSQLALYPAATIEAAERALTLLTKVLQLVQSLGLDQREIRYLLTHASDFDGLSLSKLPTVTSIDSSAERAATAQRFAGFRRLAAYSRLKRDWAGGTDDLIAIFESNETSAADRLEKQVYPLVAKLTRRDEATIKATVKALVKAPVVPTFESEKPLWRLWEAVQVVERFGVPPESLLGWIDIVRSTTTGTGRFKLARDVKEAIKARFDPETWQRVAQPIFDKLRPRQRDALVSHILQQMSKNPETANIDTQEKLYEYFLVDPGMEPVVQTSRIRLAIASLQLFIQRSLLNLEPRVHPSTINSEQWEWMKRYRVWEANRKIFLFPENWLEPEFRDDKTYLFTELEDALLQGDVSSDLVEDAFLNYLKKLDELARLDICAMHIEDNFDPALRVLHVFGRTYSQPHKYFYRRYVHQVWTPWEPVSAEIEGDHLVPVVWRDRLYLFWVTFMEKAAPGKGDMTFDPTKSLTIPAVEKYVEAQLHWSEYIQGKWTTHESSEFTPLGHLYSNEDYKTEVAAGVITPSEDHISVMDGYMTLVPTTVPLSFDSKSIFVHVSKQYGDDGEEYGVFVHLSSETVNQAFYLAGRNSRPEVFNNNWNGSLGNLPNNPFHANTQLANRYSGSSELKVSFLERITTQPGKTSPKATPMATYGILQQVGGYILLPCDNNLIALGVSKDAYRDMANPAAVKAAIEHGLGEIASLLKPVFYQDNTHTLFIEPSVIETTIEEWHKWVIRTPETEPSWRDPNWWKELVVIPEIPRKWTIPNLGDPGRIPIDSGSLINPIPERDWLVNPVTALEFDGVLIGPAGQPGLKIVTGTDATGVITNGHIKVNVNPGSGIPAGSVVFLTEANALEKTGLMQPAGGLNVVSRVGFNSALAQNFNASKSVGFGANMSNADRISR